MSRTAHLTRSLSADTGSSRIIFADLREPRELPTRVEYAKVDVRDAIQLEISGDVEIFNLAAVHTTPGHEDWQYYWTKVKGAIEVCRFCRKVMANKIVFASTMGMVLRKSQSMSGLFQSR